MSTRASIRLFVWIGVTLVTVSLIAISLLTYSQVANTRASRNLVIANLKTIQRQQRFLACLRTAEAGQRGYLLTHNPSYLEPYNHCSVEVIPALDGLTSGPMNSDMVQKYTTVRRLATFKLAELAKTITQSKTEGFDKALETVKTNSGMNSMEKVQAIVDDLRRQEEAELKTKSAELDTRVQNLESLISLSSVLGILAVFGTGLWMIKFLTEKTRAEQFSLLSAAQARRSKNELDLVLSSVGEGIYQIDEKGNVTYLNKAAKTLLGYDFGQVLGKNAHDLFHTHSAEGQALSADKCPLDQVVKQKQDLNREIDWFIKKDKTVITVRCTSMPLLSETGEILGAVVSFLDVTEEENREKRLELQYAVSKILAERGTADDTIMEVITKACEKIGWEVGSFWQFDPESESLRLKTQYCMPIIDATEFKALSKELVFKTGKGLPGRVLQSRVGVWITDVADDESLPRRDAANLAGLRTTFAFPIVLGENTLGVIEFFTTKRVERDEELLTTFTSVGRQLGQLLQRKIQEEQIAAGQEILKVNQKRLELAIRGSQDGIWDWDIAKQLMYVSSKCREILKYPPGDAQITADDWMAMVHPEDLPMVRKAVKDHLKLHMPFECEYRIRGNDGEYYRFNSRGQALWDAKGNPTRFSGSLRDISERKEAERRISEFYSTVSHELRTPLTSIRGSLGLIEGGKAGEVPAKVMRLISIGRAESDRLIRIINDILDIKKIETGQFELNKESCDPKIMVARTIEGISGMAVENDVTLVSEINTGKQMYGDVERLVQVLTNLISNAIKYSEKGQTVTVKVEETITEMLRFSIIDHGQGIPPEKKHKLFGMFQQLDSSDTRKKGGTGLGLAISKSIVQQHGGKIDVDSEFGSGSTFWFEIPSLQTKMVQPKNSNVLVIEKDEHWSTVLKIVFEDGSYEIVNATTIEQAETKLADRPALIVFDLASSQDGGKDFLQRIKQDEKTSDIPVIVLSGQDKESGSAILLDWISQPSDPSSIKQSLINALENTSSCAKVLIVEDDNATREVLRQQIGALGVKCIEASDGAQALSMVRNELPDLMILDLGLPLIDGFDVVGVLRQEDNRELPLIVYTNRDLSRDEKARLSLGPTSHLVKARTTEDELVACVKELLKGTLA